MSGLDQPARFTQGWSQPARAAVGDSMPATVSTSHAAAPELAHCLWNERLIAIDRLDDPEPVDRGYPTEIGGDTSSLGSWFGHSIFQIYPVEFKIASRLVEIAKGQSSFPSPRRGAGGRRPGEGEP